MLKQNGFCGHWQFLSVVLEITSPNKNSTNCKTKQFAKDDLCVGAGWLMLIFWFLKMDKPVCPVCVKCGQYWFYLILMFNVLMCKMLCTTGHISCRPIPGSSQGFDSRHVSHSSPSLWACHRKQCMAGCRVDHERGVMSDGWIAGLFCSFKSVGSL